MTTVKTRPAIAMLVAATAVLLSACAREDAAASAGNPPSTDPATGPPAAELAAAACVEARVELVELAAVTSGMRPFADAALRSQFIEQLAVERNAPEPVRNDLVQWKAQVDRRRLGVREIPPQYEDGRLLAPDTAAIDRQFIDAMRPVGERLGAWVAESCGASPRQTATASASRLPLQSAHFPG